MCAQSANFVLERQTEFQGQPLGASAAISWDIKRLVKSLEVQEAVMNRILKSETMLQKVLVLSLCILIPAMAWGQKKTTSAPAPKAAPAPHASAPAQHAAAPSHSSAPSHSTAPSHANTTAGHGTTTAGHGTTTAGHGTTAAGHGTTTAGHGTTAAGHGTTT